LTDEVVATDLVQETRLMRLYPPVSSEEAVAFLTREAVISWGASRISDLADEIARVGKDIAAVSEVTIDDGTEPLFP
jgi:hypothetical protein